MATTFPKLIYIVIVSIVIFSLNGAYYWRLGLLVVWPNRSVSNIVRAMRIEFGCYGAHRVLNLCPTRFCCFFVTGSPIHPQLNRE